MNVTRLRRVSALAATAALVCGLAACGGSGGNATAKSTATQVAASGGEQLSLAAGESGGLKFSKSALKSGSGSVTITMHNPSGNALPHAIAIEGHGVDKDGAIAQPGSTSTITVDLKPGKYTFYCPVGNHRQQGMEGTLTVG